MVKEIKWTFVADALPSIENEGDRYFVTTCVGRVTLAWWKPHLYEGRLYGGVWFDCFDYSETFDEIEDVVAWAPFTFPDPYHTEKEDENV